MVVMVAEGHARRVAQWVGREEGKKDGKRGLADGRDDRMLGNVSVRG